MKNLLLLAAAALFATGVAFSQGEEPAEKVYKNIQVFRGVPAKDLIPAMKFMSASMKVKCSYCHLDNDYASDAKHEKETTRKMVELQRSINNQFFEGKLEVTCQTCHNGLAHPEGTPRPAELPAKHQRIESGLRAEDFVKKHNEAVGGELAGLILKGKVVEADETELPFELTQSGSTKYLFVRGTSKAGSDGAKTWYQDGGQTFPLFGDPVYQLGLLGRPWRGAAAFGRFGRLSVVGRNNVGGKSVVVLRGTVDPENATEELYFDQESGLLLRVAIMVRSTIGTVVNVMDFSDYRAVEGVKVPFKIVTESPERGVETITFETAKANQPLDPKIFEMPGG